MKFTQISMKEASSNLFDKNLYACYVDNQNQTITYKKLYNITPEQFKNYAENKNAFFCKIDWKGDINEKDNSNSNNDTLEPWAVPGQLRIADFEGHEGILD